MDTYPNEKPSIEAATTARGPSINLDKPQETDDGENGTAAIRSVSATVFTYFMIVAYII